MMLRSPSGFFLEASHMTRSELVAALASRFSHLPLRDAEVAVKTILDAMGDALEKGQRIEIRGFGSFSVNHRAPRLGRNPRTGEAVDIPPKRVPHFKPGKALREAVDERARSAEAASTAQPTPAPKAARPGGRDGGQA